MNHQVQGVRQGGAKVCSGGQPPAERAKETCYLTIVESNSGGCCDRQEEIFGPVALYFELRI
ncbi:MAG: hypothetical protein CLLPBCKN_004506 [Chroococcidiopsis cubana SAG 39.79]|uniref:hypothetical protein n=1 Tax=Chroococcidiopsis cubana TaxID=171392 RepID=UPI002AC539D0|nr:hypothetical protein [Chroococcidiopsis cubana]MDZ4875110.1 hypothetical protein [Chroococcidiopsis cubana SAG 39.79]